MRESVGSHNSARRGNFKKLSPEDERCIALFRGHPRDPVQKRWSPKSMDALVARALKEFAVLESTTPETQIRDNWANIVGETWSSYCVPAKIMKDGTLVVLIANPVHRQEISFQKRAILRKIRGLSGCRHIKSVLLRGG